MSERSDALRWLDSRRPVPPESLLSRLRAALGAMEPTAGGSATAHPAGDSGTIAPTEAMGRGPEATAALARQLASAAVEWLRKVIAGPGDRASALDLLTADALLTYAFEAAAEAGPEAVNAVAADFGPGRLVELLSSGER